MLRAKRSVTDAARAVFTSAALLCAAAVSVYLYAVSARDSRLDLAVREAADRGFEEVARAVRACRDPMRFVAPALPPAGEVRVSVIRIDLRRAGDGYAAEVTVQARLRAAGRVFSHVRKGSVRFGEPASQSLGPPRKRDLHFAGLELRAKNCRQGT